eukprot:139331-Hanusia_phi.AAC.1
MTAPSSVKIEFSMNDLVLAPARDMTTPSAKVVCECLELCYEKSGHGRFTAGCRFTAAHKDYT